VEPNSKFRSQSVIVITRELVEEEEAADRVEEGHWRKMSKLTD